MVHQTRVCKWGNIGCLRSINDPKIFPFSFCFVLKRKLLNTIRPLPLRIRSMHGCIMLTIKRQCKHGVWCSIMQVCLSYIKYRVKKVSGNIARQWTADVSFIIMKKGGLRDTRFTWPKCLRWEKQITKTTTSVWSRCLSPAEFCSDFLSSRSPLQADSVGAMLKTQDSCCLVVRLKFPG